MIEVAKLYGLTLSRLFRWPWRWNEILQATVQIGIESLPIIVTSTAFAGFVMTTEIAWHMDEALHTITMVPGFTGQFIIREIGIAIPVLLLVAKVGASTTAEVGTMKVTEQIDALKLLGIDPISYLVFPRFIACILSVVALTFISIGVTLVCAMAVAVFKYGFSVMEYINALRPFLKMSDLGGALIKGVTFGSVIPVVSCSFGFQCRGGAEGVGKATTQSVVTSTILVIILDFVITFALR